MNVNLKNEPAAYRYAQLADGKLTFYLVMFLGINRVSHYLGPLVYDMIDSLFQSREKYFVPGRKIRTVLYR